MASQWCVLALLVVLPVTLSTDAGVKVRLTQKGLEYGRQIGVTSLQQKLKSIKLPDMSGTESLAPVGKVTYILTGMQITNLGLPQSGLGLVPGVGVSLSIGNAFISIHGNWRVKYLRIIKDKGSFDLGVNGLTITTGVGLQRDETGHPVVNSTSCVNTLGNAHIKFHGGASWLYNLFSSFINKALRGVLQKQICPLVAETVAEMNPYLKTLNVLAKVDQYAEVDYSMVANPDISNSSIDLGLKGEFYNINKHQKPPFSPTPFLLPPEEKDMLYLGLSAYTINSAGFVYHNAGALSLYITDDMIPPSSPIRLSTKTFGTFIPQIAKKYPGLLMKLLVKTAKAPALAFQPDNVTVQTNGTVTAYAIQTNGTLTPLFVLNMDASVSARVYITGVKLAGSIALNKVDITLGISYVGPFQVKSLDNILLMVLKFAVIPEVNARLQQGYPLPAIGQMNLVNSQLRVQKGYMLIGTDVKFSG